jgi:hypothetical protein
LNLQEEEEEKNKVILANSESSAQRPSLSQKDKI